MHLAQIERAGIVALTAGQTLAAGLIGGAASGGVSAEHLEFVGVVVGAVVAVVTVVAWIDRRIDRKIREQDKINRMRYRKTRSDMRHLVEMLAVRFQLELPPAESDDEDPDGG